MDRGADNNDKTGRGTDGNNGCGNEPRRAAPRDGGRPTDDDNNGWCGGKAAPERSASKPAKADKPEQASKPAKPAKPAKADKPAKPAKPAKADKPAKPAKPVKADKPKGPKGKPVVSTPISGGGQTGVTGPTTRPVTKPAPVAQRPVAAVGAGTVAQPAQAPRPFVGPVAATAGAGVVAQSAVTPQALPFTGAPVVLLLLIGGLAFALGAVLLSVSARRTV